MKTTTKKAARIYNVTLKNKVPFTNKIKPTTMKLFKYLLFIALFAGITVPLLTSCSNDDDEALPIEGYWYVRDNGDYPVNYAMWVFKNGKYASVYTYKSYITKSELKEYVDEAFRSNKVSNSSVYISDKGTYTLKGKKLKLADIDGDVDYVYVSFQKSNSVMVWEDEEWRMYLQRYTEE